VRFGKRTRHWAAAGRRLLADRFAPQDMATALIEEEHIPSMAGELENHTMMSAYDEEPVITGDPTQRLLTALGRFQRQVTRAENSASQEDWCDACMTQVIAGLEIAISEEWDNVREALIDTARILQTYEEYQRASEALPFLKDAYEILCLMVGDLLVDNVRSGVLTKWRDRYRQAVDDVEAAGMTLVEDESEESSHEPNEITESGVSSAPTVSEPVSRDYQEQEDDFQDAASTDLNYRESYGEAHDTDDDQHGMAPNDTTEDEEDPVSASPFETPPNVQHVYNSTWESQLDEIEDSSIDTEAPALDDLMMEASNPMINEIQSDSKRETYDSGMGEGVPDKQFVEELFHEQKDDWDEALNELADSEMDILTHSRVDFVPEDLDIDEESLREEEDTEQPAQEPDAEAALRVEDSMGYIDTTGSMLHDDESSQALHETLEEDGVSADIVQEEESLHTMVGEFTLNQANIEEDSLADSIDEPDGEDEAAGEAELETETLLSDEQQEMESAIATASPAPDSPEALWQTIQAAFSKGNVSDAKVIALQLAAQMAHLEVSKAQDNTKKLEDQLALDEDAIEKAQEAYEQVKKDVQDSEWLLGEKNAALLKQQESLLQLQAEAEHIQSGIDDLERQIAELQQRCEQEIERLDVVQEQIGEVRKVELSIEEEAKTLQENGNNSKTALEMAEERMKRLEEERANHLLELESARNLLREQESSEKDIRKTIKMFSGNIEDDTTADQSLEE